MILLSASDNRAGWTPDHNAAPDPGFPLQPAKGELTLEGQDGDRLYRRAFTMPDGIDASHITADLANGVLTLKLPKAPEVKPRRIEIRAA